MVTSATAGDAGNARWTFRLRVSSAARTCLMDERDRCRWIWNECVAESCSRPTPGTGLAPKGRTSGRVVLRSSTREGRIQSDQFVQRTAAGEEAWREARDRM